jgi:hypothetical protein
MRVFFEQFAQSFQPQIPFRRHLVKESTHGCQSRLLHLPLAIPANALTANQANVFEREQMLGEVLARTASRISLKLHRR